MITYEALIVGNFLEGIVLTVLYTYYAFRTLIAFFFRNHAVIFSKYTGIFKKGVLSTGAIVAVEIVLYRKANS